MSSNIRLQDESDILNPDFRAKIIEEILGPENKARKQDIRKRYDLLKDRTRPYVIAEMQNEQGEEAMAEAQARAANISFYKRTCQKKAMVYKDGVIRLTPEDEDQADLDSIVDLMNINTTMKKVNLYLEAFRNTAIRIFPWQDKQTGKWCISTSVLAPDHYDVIEDADNPEMPRVFIFSYATFSDSGPGYADQHQSGQRKDYLRSNINFRQGDGVDQGIADSPSDKGKEKLEFVWWSNGYHFTTDAKGEVIQHKSPEDLSNPIQCLPFVSFHKDQDGSFWAQGGDDLVTGTILINLMLTDLNYITYLQGHGVFFLFGKGVPKNLKVGPRDALVMEVDEGETPPQIGFATSNPPIESHLRMIEKYIGYLLATNGIDPGTVIGTLDGTNANSGIQEIIQRSELLDDIEDQREQYRDKEPLLFKIIFKWLNLYSEGSLLKDEFQQLGTIDEDMQISLKFAEPVPYMSEKEKLDVIKIRKELGLDTMADSIKKDNPELTEEEVDRKLIDLLEEKVRAGRALLITEDEDEDDAEEPQTEDE